MPEWPKGADCKSAGLPSKVRILPGPPQGCPGQNAKSVLARASSPPDRRSVGWSARRPSPGRRPRMWWRPGTGPWSEPGPGGSGRRRDAAPITARRSRRAAGESSDLSPGDLIGSRLVTMKLRNDCGKGAPAVAGTVGDRTWRPVAGSRTRLHRPDGSDWRRQSDRGEAPKPHAIRDDGSRGARGPADPGHRLRPSGPPSLADRGLRGRALATRPVRRGRVRAGPGPGLPVERPACPASEAEPAGSGAPAGPPRLRGHGGHRHRGLAAQLAVQARDARRLVLRRAAHRRAQHLGRLLHPGRRLRRAAAVDAGVVGHDPALRPLPGRARSSG